MQNKIAQIKRAFKGDERFMILNTYYRQNHYHPFYTLRSALSILIEIPFFIAGYHFLSNCSILNNASLGFLHDLGKPDCLFSIGNFGINVLPILMTLINAVSTAVYTKGAPIREKLQAYILALIFLVLLYNSPSGLVFYWIMNNLFSLAKNVVNKCKNPRKIVHAVICLILCLISLYFFIYHHKKMKSLWIYGLTLCVIFAPLIHRILLNKFPVIRESKLPKHNFGITIFSCFALALLAGLVIPTSIIQTSPIEFSFIGNVQNPLYFVKTSILFFTGLFVFWPICIYKMFGDKTKKYMSILFSITTFCALLNTFIFKYDYGTIDIFFKVENYDCFTDYSAFFSLLPLLALVIVCATIFFIYKKNKTYGLSAFCLIICITEVAIGIWNIGKISKEYKRATAVASIVHSNHGELIPEFNLSKTQKNVMVLLLDRTISDYFPTIIEKIPGLKEKFNGFTYYPNCLSFGESTVSGSPALLGGYEYTPEKMCERENMTLKEKHNEAIKVMPKLFSDAGYSVTFADPPWMNYQVAFDPEGVFNGFENIKVIPVESKFGLKYIMEHKEDFPLMDATETACQATIKYFSIIQMLYPPLRGIVYHDGYYYTLPEKTGSSRGIDYFAELYYLPELTEFSNKKPTWTFIYNETAHEYQTMIGEDFRPGAPLTESEFSSTLGYWKDNSSQHRDSFHVNAAALIQIGKYFDYIKENGCYDNTRIIVVSDHGRNHHFNCFSSFQNFSREAGYFNPLLLVKDFNSNDELRTDMTLRTNADTVYLAIKDLNISDINPYTKNKIACSDDFESFNLYQVFEAGDRNAFKYKDYKKFSLDGRPTYNVKDNIFIEENWKKK